jgi:hypothetical protein
MNSGRQVCSTGERQRGSGALAALYRRRIEPLPCSTYALVVHMTKSDRLSHIIQVYLAGELELDTAVAEVTHVYLERGWRFVLIEADCRPQYRERMRVLAARVEAEVLPR